MTNSLTLIPRMSEKSYEQSHAQNTFAFDVPLTTNKVEVKNAVQIQFKVVVEDVRILRSKGKTARSIRLGGTRKNVTGKRPDTKKAYVKLAEGSSIPIFAKIDEETEKQEKLQEKMDKKAGKEDKKTTVKKPKLPFMRKKKGEEA